MLTDPMRAYLRRFVLALSYSLALMISLSVFILAILGLIGLALHLADTGHPIGAAATLYLGAPIIAAVAFALWGAR